MAPAHERGRVMAPLTHLARARDAHRPEKKPLHPFAAGDQSIGSVGTTRSTRHGLVRPRQHAQIVVVAQVVLHATGGWVDHVGDPAHVVGAGRDVQQLTLVLARRVNRLRYKKALVVRSLAGDRTGAFAYAGRGIKQVITTARMNRVV